MKKYLLAVTCLLLSGTLLSQDKYTVPVPPVDQKHSNALYQLYTFMGAGISFAKSQGVSPYDYGKYVGKLFAPSWPSGDMDVFIKGVRRHMEMIRGTSDPSIQVKENPDGSVDILNDEKILFRYVGDNNKYTPTADFMSFIKGVYEPIADRFGATLTPQLKNGFVVYTVRKK